MSEKRTSLPSKQYDPLLKMTRPPIDAITSANSAMEPPQSWTRSLSTTSSVPPLDPTASDRSGSTSTESSSAASVSNRRSTPTSAQLERMSRWHSHSEDLSFDTIDDEQSDFSAYPEQDLSAVKVHRGSPRKVAQILGSASPRKPSKIAQLTGHDFLGALEMPTRVSRYSFDHEFGNGGDDACWESLSVHDSVVAPADSIGSDSYTDDQSSIVSLASIRGGLTDPRMSKYLLEGRRLSSFDLAELPADENQSLQTPLSPPPPSHQSPAIGHAEKVSSEEMSEERRRLEEEIFGKEIWTSDLGASTGLFTRSQLSFHGSPARPQISETRKPSLVRRLTGAIRDKPVVVSAFDTSDDEGDEVGGVLVSAKKSLSFPLRRISDARHKRNEPASSSKAVSNRSSLPPATLRHHSNRRSAGMQSLRVALHIPWRPETPESIQENEPWQSASSREQRTNFTTPLTAVHRRALSESTRCTSNATYLTQKGVVQFHDLVSRFSRPHTMDESEVRRNELRKKIALVEGSGEAMIVTAPG